ncbi:MAG TPA: family 78 glycoside hydrolase catalytic domain, partial [Coriobacteriia bacterium]|nr:family 78 glycoside hydrolase catalytic domain [Coriobacteriia bacterium]
MNALRPYDLRVEHRHTPLGIDTSQPRLSWRLAADANDVDSVAYRVSVAPDPDNARVWDTGWVDDASLADVPYAGPLEPRTRYVWSVQVRDTGGHETPPVASWFETGMLRLEEFAGAWIAVDQDADSVDRDTDPPQDDDIPNTVRTIPPVAYLRRQFVLPSSVRSARIHATAHGIYTLRLNGERVGRDELTPGWTDYSQRVQYQTYDVTSLLRAGANALGILLADGWWSGYVGFDRRRQGNHYGVFPEAWLQLEIVHDDGRRETLTTDDAWRSARGTIQYTDILMGEAQDARHDLGAWSEPAYDDSAWAPVSTRAADFATFVGQVDEPVRVVEEIAARTVTRDLEGRFIYDFGQNLVGRVRIDLGALPQDAKVVFRHGETLEDGRLYTANLRTAEQRDVYISAGRDDNLFEPVFTFHGFRYLEVTGLEAAPELASVVARVLASATPEAGVISTSSDDVNRLISNIRWGQRGNFVSLPTDCPQRDERLGWMGDAQVFLPTAALNADVQSFFTRWLADVRGAQTVEGSFTDVVPALHPFTSDGAPAWADAGVIIPWHLYRTYGDRRLLADSYESMHRWVDFVEQHNSSLLWTHRVGNNYGDWLQIDALTPRALLATAY